MLHDSGSHFIPETKFRSITIFIISISLGIGILIPNIELVLGLVGSTIGVSICVLFPTTCFICMVKKNTNERVLAQVMLCIGIVVMVLGTYANLNVVDDITLGASEHTPLKLNSPNVHKDQDKVILDIPTSANLDISSIKLEKMDNNKSPDNNVIKDVRHEPPQPMPPLEQSREIQPKETKLPQAIPGEPKIQVKEPELKEIRHEPPQPVEPEQSINQIKQNESPVNPIEQDSKANILKDNISLSKQSQEKVVNDRSVNDQVDAEAIKKEEKEISRQAQEELKNVVQKLNLISELQKQNQEQQQQIVEQQQQLWEEMKQRKNAEQELRVVHKETIKEAVKEIEDIAKKAIKSIVDDDSKELLESKIIAHPNDKASFTNLTRNSSVQIQSNVKVNPAPLSYQLGLNAANETHSSKNEKVLRDAFLPFPIIKSNMLTNNVSLGQSHNSSRDSSDVPIKNNSIVPSLEKSGKVETSNNKVELNIPVPVNLNITSEVLNRKTDILAHKENIIPETKNELQEIKSMRRDILSENENNMRNKRDLSDSHIANQVSIQCEQNKTDSEIIPNEMDENKINELVHNLELTNLADNTKKIKEDENCDKP